MGIKDDHFQSMKTLGWSDEEIEFDWNQVCIDLDQFFDDVKKPQIKDKMEIVKLIRVEDEWAVFAPDGDFLEKIYGDKSKVAVMEWIDHNIEYSKIEEL